MALTKLLKRIGKYCLWISIFLLVAITLLYLARIPLSIALLESASKDQALSVECLDWHLTLTPSLRINDVCLNTDNIKLIGSDINWPYFNRTLDIQHLTLTHKPPLQTTQNDSPAFNLNGVALPTNIPLIQIDKLLIDSYLLNKPVKLSIQQESTNSLRVAGDIEAKVSLINRDSGNALQAKINWVPNKLIAAIPQLKALMSDVEPYLVGSQHWKDQPIRSELKFSGTSLTSHHSLMVKQKLQFEHCKLDVSFAGTIETSTTIDNLFTQIDLTQLPLTIGIAECDKLAILSQELATSELTLLVENSVEITPSELKLSKIRIQDSLSSSRLSVLLQKTEIQLDDKNQSKGQYLAQFDLPYYSTLAKTEIKAAVSGEFNVSAEDIFITVNSDNVELNNVILDGDTFAKADRVFGNANGQYHSGKFVGSGKISVEDVGIFPQGTPPNNTPSLVIKSLASQFQLEGSSDNKSKLVLTNKISNMSYQNTSVTHINNSTSATLSDWNELDLTATSEIKNPKMADFAVKSIAIKHQVRATINRDNNDFKSQGTHEFSLDSGVFGSLMHSIEAGSNVLNIELPEQSVLPLQPQLTKINRNITLKSGQFASKMQYDIKSSQGIGAFSLNALNIDYAEYKIRGVNVQERFTLNSAELQLPEAKVLIDSLNVGVPINNITVVIAPIEKTYKLLEAKGSIFGGQFILNNFWLDGRDQELKISAVDLSLAELAALQKQSGIEVTGEIGGSLPLLITAGEFNINKAKLASQHPGTLKIKNNAAFDSIKKSQQQLALLENLNYEKLETNVSLSPDGWLKLDFSILGKNPDKNQAVNFNYGHEENIFTLLKALRITNSVQQGIEKKIEDKYSDKNKPNKGNQ